MLFYLNSYKYVFNRHFKLSMTNKRTTLLNDDINVIIHSVLRSAHTMFRLDINKRWNAKGSPNPRQNNEKRPRKYHSDRVNGKRRTVRPHSPVQELERLLAFDRSFAAEVNALGRISGATVGRHERRTEQCETADGYRERGTESGHGGRLEHETGPRDVDLLTSNNGTGGRARRGIATPAR